MNFEIIKKKTNKTSAEGYGIYTMVNVITGRSAKIPDWIKAKYAV